MSGLTRGLFGGSFDPIHRGHLIVARSAAEQLRLDVVHFVPARIQPFKTDRRLAPSHDRLAMLELALSDQAGFLVDDREIRRSGTSYTIDTVEEVRAEAPQDRLCLLVGADAAAEFPAWREASRIAQLARVVILTRPGAEAVPRGLTAETVAVPAVEISATLVRRRIRDGEPIRDLVPPPVAEYIESHGLYRTEE